MPPLSLFVVACAAGADEAAAGLLLVMLSGGAASSSSFIIALCCRCWFGWSTRSAWLLIFMCPTFRWRILWRQKGRTHFMDKTDDVSTTQRTAV